MLTHRVVDNNIYQKLVVHSFTMGDVDDVEIYAANPIYNWQQTDAGKFVMERALEQPEFHKQQDFVNYGYKIAITAWLKEQDVTYFCLRWK